MHDDELDSVKIIVDTNRAKFEKEAETIQRAQNDLEQHGPMEDAWAQICPEAELERLECLDSKKEQPIETEEGDDVIPDLLPNAGASTLENNPSAITKKDAKALPRSLNEKQSQIFYKVRQWCLAKVQGSVVLGPAPDDAVPQHALESVMSESPAITSATPESSAIMDTMSVLPGIMNVSHEAIKVAL
ncbi:ATP-dependent DNA helicase RRM3 [Labeo rohita]|uniref:ATP-dependent DNA helicase RRM3 n=1 Tax=Labeo rohita TaxID=84645 RepID=A0A498M0W9_LABRO|nr:ATP-dependent DNA helicase RRM3 [Labeo rohita]